LRAAKRYRSISAGETVSTSATLSKPCSSVSSAGSRAHVDLQRGRSRIALALSNTVQAMKWSAAWIGLGDGRSIES
jgi:hypothetical protein